ncbi:MAG: cytochrome c family protein [Desulfovibrionaceae bacterium]
MSKYAILLFLLISAGLAGSAWSQESNRYIGSARCGECHDEQHEFFTRDSKKAHSWNSIERMKSNLKPNELKECYTCHTTGYGQPGGFVSYESTPEMADVGCETCHGPGERHAESLDTADIKRTPTIKDCEHCHSKERIHDFQFKPLRFSGAH